MGALALVRRVGEDSAEYHTEATRNRVDIWLKGGIIDPKHCEAMGVAVWLYLYLQARSDFETGRVPVYTHAAAAVALGKPEGTIQRWFRQLRDAGYLRCQQHQHTAEVQITRYVPQSERRRGSPKMKTLRSQGLQICDSGSSDMNGRVSISEDPLYTSNVSQTRSNDGVVTTGEPDAPAETPPPPVSEQPDPTPKPTADDLGVTPTEQDWLKQLRTIPTWPKGWRADLRLLREEAQRYGVEAVTDGIREYRDSSKPKSDDPRNQVKAYIRTAAKRQAADTARAGPVSDLTPADEILARMEARARLGAAQNGAQP